MLSTRTSIFPPPSTLLPPPLTHYPHPPPSRATHVLTLQTSPFLPTSARPPAPQVFLGHHMFNLLWKRPAQPCHVPQLGPRTQLLPGSNLLRCHHTSLRAHACTCMLARTAVFHTHACTSMLSHTCMLTHTRKLVHARVHESMHTSHIHKHASHTCLHALMHMHTQTQSPTGSHHTHSLTCSHTDPAAFRKAAVWTRFPQQPLLSRLWLQQAPLPHPAPRGRCGV